MGNACRRPETVRDADGDGDGGVGGALGALGALGAGAGGNITLPSSAKGEAAAPDGARASAASDGVRPVRRMSFDRLRSAKAPTRGTTRVDGFYDEEAVEGAPWWNVVRPTPWTGPPPPVVGCESDVEELFVGDLTTARTHRGVPMYAWEGDEWSAPQIFEIIQHGLTCADVNDALGRPCTLKMSAKDQVQHLRNAIADVLQTAPFEFAMRVFEGADTPPDVAVGRFLRRLCEASGGGVYCKLPALHKTKEACLAHLHDTKHVGAAIYTRIYMTRFVKRFPPQHGFRHPEIDSPATKERVVRELSDAMSMFQIIRATKKHPAMLFMTVTTESVKKLFAMKTIDAWYGVNQAYEATVAEPSENLSDKTSPMVVDIKGVSVSLLTRASIATIAKQLAVAEFHPEPFSHFIVTNCPYFIAALWSIGKLFLTESARKKFVICTGDFATEIRKRYSLDNSTVPEELGGEERGTVMDSTTWLALVPQENAIREFQKELSIRSAADAFSGANTHKTIATPSSKVKAPGGFGRSWSSLTVAPRVAFRTGIRPMSMSFTRIVLRAIELAFTFVFLAFVTSITMRYVRTMMF